MASAATPNFQAVKAELGRTIRRFRQDCPPMETARQLLSYDGPGQRLIGIRYDGGRAVYFDEGGRRAIAISFDAAGPASRGGLPIATLETEGALGAWVEKTRYYWGWRNPRYRAGTYE